MFKFEDKDIQSEMSEAVHITSDKFESDKGFLVVVNNTEILLTKAEIEYMMDAVNKL
ncbi:hypothetical protein KUA24_134 [Vibrio phage HNL01]|nr:hypothetical protein KUA24_134 [Vibrio phage HNL01]